MRCSSTTTEFGVSVVNELSGEILLRGRRQNLRLQVLFHLKDKEELQAKNSGDVF